MNFFAEAAHDASLSFWDELWSITFDPAHIVSELIWQIVFDGLFVALLYGVIFKRWLLPKLRKQIHAELDEEHGIEHHDDHIHVTVVDHHENAHAHDQVHDHGHDVVHDVDHKHDHSRGHDHSDSRRGDLSH